MTKRKILNGGKKKTQSGGAKERKVRRACQGFHEGGFRPYQPDKGAGKDFLQNKGRGKDQEGKGYPDSQPQKHPKKKDMARPENQTIGLLVIGLLFFSGLQMLDGSAQRLILHGWWQSH